jgi:Flp pilus assembly protein TadD
VSGGDDGVPAAAGPGLAVERARSMAARYNEMQRWDEAEREARRGLQAEPDDLNLLVQLARSQLGREQPDEAERTCAQGLAAHPQAVPLMAFLGAIQMQRGRMSEAERTLLNALAHDPLDAAALSVYGNLMHAAGQFDKAEALYRRALASDPESARVHGHLARLQGERGQGRSAETRARFAARLDPDAVTSHSDLGWVSLRGGHPFAARRHFREALRLDPTDGDLERAWLEADKCCRFVYLPYYGWSLLLERVPGRQFAVWGAMVGLGLVAGSLGVPRGVVTGVFLGYIVLCVYTWIAPALLAGWLRLVPPRIDR